MQFFKWLSPFFFLLVFHSFTNYAQEIQTTKVKDNLYFVGDRTFSCFYVTDTGVIVIDPLDSVRATATLAAIRKVTDKPVTHVFYSHNHWDHISGGNIFGGSDPKYISHIEAKNNITPNPKVIMPTDTWKGESKTYSFGSKHTLELYHYGRNHGDGMTVFRFPEHNAVFIIDLVVPDRVLYAYLPDASPKNWVKSLEKIQKLEFEEVYMAHMRVKGTRADVTFMQKYFEDLYAAVEKELASDTPFFDIPDTVELPQYKHLKNYEKWLPMNVWRIMMEKAIGK